MINFLQGFVCGHIGGVANVVSGYILDTLKVRMQMDPGSRMWQTLKSIVHNEGFFQLFNGIYYPLWWIPLVNAVVFSSYEVYKSLRCQ